MINIGIVDDHAIVRSGLRQFLSEHVDLRVVAEASNGREAIDLVRNHQVDVLLMDISMPDQSGVDALAMLRAKAPDMGILILSGYPEEHYAISLIRQGASGYLNKECEPKEIVEAIRTISLGKRYLTPSVAELLAQQLNRKDDAPPHEQLSEREFQVFLKLARGETAGDIAKALSLSVKTARCWPLGRRSGDALRRSRIECTGLRNAVVDQIIYFIGFVEHRVDTQLCAAHAHIRSGVVAEDHHPLVRFALPARRQNTQTAALAQKQIHDRQIPLRGGVGQPRFAVVFGFSRTHRLDGCKLFQRSNQVFPDRCVVFDDVSFQFHCQAIRCAASRMANEPPSQCRDSGAPILPAGTVAARREIPTWQIGTQCRRDRAASACGSTPSNAHRASAGIPPKIAPCQ